MAAERDSGRRAGLTTDERARVKKELAEDIVPPGADRGPQSDLACPLGHRDQHDVHDSEAAHVGVAARSDENEVRTEALDLFGQLLLGTGSHGDHDNDRANADDDAEHRQRAAQLVDTHGSDGTVGVVHEHRRSAVA